MDAQTNEGTRKEERPYAETARRMAEYIQRETREHTVAGSSLEAIEAYLASYIEVQLTFAHEGKVSEEEEARRLAHERAKEDLGKLVY